VIGQAFRDGAGEGSRTPTSLRTPHFECGSSASFDTPARNTSILSRDPRKEWFSPLSLAVEAGKVRRVVQPMEEADRFALGVAKMPDRPAVECVGVLCFDDTADVDDRAHFILDPRDERSARRDEAHVEPLVLVSLLLRHVIAVGVHEDRSVSVDAAPQEIGKVLSRNGERAERQTLRRGEANGQEPVVEIAVSPLNAVIDPGPLSSMSSFVDIVWAPAGIPERTVVESRATPFQTVASSWPARAHRTTTSHGGAFQNMSRANAARAMTTSARVATALVHTGW
jgi:hypothetical protein